MTWSIILVALLVIVGVLLLVAELFLLPGFGIAGITSVAALVGAVVLAYIRLNPVYPWAGEITLIACLILIVVAIYAFFRSRALEKMGLNTTIDSSVEMPDAGKHMDDLQDQKTSSNNN